MPSADEPTLLDELDDRRDDRGRVQDATVPESVRRDQSRAEQLRQTQAISEGDLVILGIVNHEHRDGDLPGE
jgi:hypothetical protein